jgi:hypothetical protein
MSRSRSQSDGAGAGLFGVAFVFAILWWLRWIILVALVITVVVVITRWVLRKHAEALAAEQARHDAISRRADLQHAQVLRGDPAGFFGGYPLPDRELIPSWYTIGRQPKLQGKRGAGP